MVKRTSWLSVTPEPEYELPEAVATLVSGSLAGPEAVAAERARVEALVLAGSQRRWLRYLHRVVDLIAAREGSDDLEIEEARERALAVVSNHHNLLLALPGSGGRVAAADRVRLQQLLDDNQPNPLEGAQ